MRDVVEAATNSAGKLIDRQQLLGWFAVAGTIFLGVTFGIAVFLGMELIEFQKKELENERTFKESLIDINQRVYALNQRSVQAIERNSIATESLVSIAQTNASIWRHMLMEAQRATKKTKEAVEVLKDHTPKSKEE